MSRFTTGFERGRFAAAYHGCDPRGLTLDLFVGMLFRIERVDQSRSDDDSIRHQLVADDEARVVEWRERAGMLVAI